MAPRLLLIAPVLLLAVAACGRGEEVTPSPTPGETAETATALATQPDETDSPTQASAVPAGLKTYTDAMFGFSFRYPSDWHLSVPDRVSGSFFILTSYDPETAKGIGGGIPSDKLKVISRVAEGVYQPLEQWLEEWNGPPSTPTVHSTTEIELGGKTGLRQVSDFQGQPSVAYNLDLGGGRVLVIGAAPADSELWSDFESILASLDFSATPRK